MSTTSPRLSPLASLLALLALVTLGLKSVLEWRAADADRSAETSPD